MGEGMDTSVLNEICTCIELLAVAALPLPRPTETQIRQGRIGCFSEDGLPVQIGSPPVKPTGQRHLNEPRMLRHWALAGHTGMEALHSSISEIYNNKCCKNCLKTLTCASYYISYSEIVWLVLP